MAELLHKTQVPNSHPVSAPQSHDLGSLRPSALHELPSSFSPVATIVSASKNSRAVTTVV